MIARPLLYRRVMLKRPIIDYLPKEVLRMVNKLSNLRKPLGKNNNKWAQNNGNNFPPTKGSFP